MPAILIDADACPVVNETIQIAQQYGFRCILICDTAHEMAPATAWKYHCFKGADAVDLCS